MALARPHPPSSQRIAEARASGHVPRAPLVGACAALVASIGVFATLADSYSRHLLALLREPLFLAGVGELESAQFSFRVHGGRLIELLAWSLTAVFASVLLASWLVQGPAFARGAVRARFQRVAIDHTASMLMVAGVALVIGIALARLALWDGTTGELHGTAYALALIALACLVVDAAFARARWFASLWMSRGEYLDAQREQGVSPELNAARARARRGADA